MLLGQRIYGLGPLRGQIGQQLLPAREHDMHRAWHVTMQSRANISEWLPAVPESFDEMAGMFRANSLELQTDFHLLNSRKDFAAQLAAIRDAERWKKVASHWRRMSAVRSLAVRATASTRAQDRAACP